MAATAKQIQPSQILYDYNSVSFKNIDQKPGQQDLTMTLQTEPDIIFNVSPKYVSSQRYMILFWNISMKYGGW